MPMQDYEPMTVSEALTIYQWLVNEELCLTMKDYHTHEDDLQLKELDADIRKYKNLLDVSGITAIEFK